METGEPNAGARNRPAREKSESADWRRPGWRGNILFTTVAFLQQPKGQTCCMHLSSKLMGLSRLCRGALPLFFWSTAMRFVDFGGSSRSESPRRSRFYVFKLPSYPQGALARRVAPRYRACGFRPIPPVAAPPFRGRPRLHSRLRLRLAAPKACGRVSSKVGKGARSRRMSPPLASLDTSRRAREISLAKGVARRYPGCAARPVPAKLSQRAPR